ncbi:MAG: homoserine kinase [Capsulimonadales bacterium]|nr:homoserine kinase [Capsulimonadales bacterium]
MDSDRLSLERDIFPPDAEPAFTISVPATSANLGPGFDALGVALGLYNQFHFARIPSGPSTSRATGEGANVLNESGGSCLVLQAAEFAAERLGASLPPLFVHIESHIPVQRGLGSSASAVVAGIAAANLLLDAALSPDVLLFLATQMEGHADNVAPALRGGFQSAIYDGKMARSLRLPVARSTQDHLRMVVCVPDRRMSTGSARAVLPISVAHDDAAFNVSRATFLTTALCTGTLDVLRLAFHDRLHQPYRAPLIPGFDDVIAGAQEAGAYGCCLSGSGSSILSFAPVPLADAVAEAMRRAFQAVGVPARSHCLVVDDGGTMVRTASWRTAKLTG